MPIVIVVEDGTPLTNSNSCASIADAKSFCLTRGVDITDSDNDTVASWLLNALDFMESYRTRYKGRKSTQTQALQWPRSGLIYVDGFKIDLHTMPVYLKLAQCQLVLDQSTGVVLFTTVGPDQTEKLVKIGPLTIEYDQTSNQAYLPAFQSLIAPLLTSTAYLTTERI